MQAANTQATNLCSKLKIGNYKQPNDILIVQETVMFKTDLGEIPCGARNLCVAAFLCAYAKYPWL